MRWIAAQLDGDAAAIGRELDRVAHVVAQHVLQLVFVGSHLADRVGGRQLQFDLLAFRGSAAALHDPLHQLAQLDGPELQSLGARLEAGVIEQTVHQLE